MIDYRVAAKLIPDSDPWHAQALTRITELERHLAAVEAPKAPANDDTASADDASPAGARVALVIGNSAYAQAGKLANPEKDAAAIL